MPDSGKDLFLEYLDKRIFLLTKSFIAVMSHETEMEAVELRIEAKVLKRVREKYLNSNAGSTPDR